MHIQKPIFPFILRSEYSLSPGWMLLALSLRISRNLGRLCHPGAAWIE